MKFAGTIQRRVAPNLAPLIDVLLLLVIFFAVSSTFLEQPGVELQLPEAETSEFGLEQEMVIYVDKDEDVYLNSRPVQISELVEAIAPEMSSLQGRPVVLRADKDVRHGLVIAIIDALRKGGIFRVVVSTEKPAAQ